MKTWAMRAGKHYLAHPGNGFVRDLEDAYKVYAPNRFIAFFEFRSRFMFASAIIKNVIKKRNLIEVREKTEYRWVVRMSAGSVFYLDRLCKNWPPSYKFTLPYAHHFRSYHQARKQMEFLFQSPERPFGMLFAVKKVRRKVYMTQAEIWIQDLFAPFRVMKSLCVEILKTSKLLRSWR